MSGKVLRGLEAVNQLAGYLSKIGIKRRWRSQTGSRYLSADDHMRFMLRLSDHRWSGFSAQRQCQVVLSEIVREIDARALQAEAERIKARYFERIAQRLALATPTKPGS